jgi:hypothetical protein
MKGFKDEMITTDRDEVWEAVNTSRWDLLESMEDEDSKERMERINKVRKRDQSKPTEGTRIFKELTQRLSFALLLP